jgi:hypothetical protein
MISALLTTGSTTEPENVTLGSPRRRLMIMARPWSTWRKVRAISTISPKNTTTAMPTTAMSNCLSMR